jgi:hypothetical protein
VLLKLRCDITGYLGRCGQPGGLFFSDTPRGGYRSGSHAQVFLVQENFQGAQLAHPDFRFFLTQEDFGVVPIGATLPLRRRPGRRARVFSFFRIFGTSNSDLARLSFRHAQCQGTPHPRRHVGHGGGHHLRADGLLGLLRSSDAVMSGRLYSPAHRSRASQPRTRCRAPGTSPSWGPFIWAAILAPHC